MTLVARIVIPAGAAPADPDVAAALAWERPTGDLTVTIDTRGVWSHEGFNLHLGEDFQPPFGYHPHGRAGKLATFVAEQVGVVPKFLIRHRGKPGTVY